MQLEIVVLAAGRGLRMRSQLPKVLHTLAGKPLIRHVLDMTRQLNPHKIHVVVGYGCDAVKSACSDLSVNWVEQTEQLGTGHAVLQAASHVTQDSQVLILYGDVPLLTPSTVDDLIIQAAGRTAVLTAKLSDPAGYGRVVRTPSGAFGRIVEHEDATEEEREIDEVNTGVLVVPAKYLKTYLPLIEADNSQAEYYLPDILPHLQRINEQIEMVRADPEEIVGINDRIQLAAAEQMLRARRASKLMEEGATLIDPQRVDIRGEVECGEDVVIDINVIFQGKVSLGDGVSVGANSFISNSKVGANTIVHPMTILDGAVVDSFCSIGPFARVRPGTIVYHKAKVGNFVETKNAVLGEASKANHLAYLGDAKIGTSTNIGAGTITCNYDGVEKHLTDIGDDTFVGSNSTLVAPVKIGMGAFISAGSTVTKDVPAKELAVARSSQRNIPGWKRPHKPRKS